MQKRKRGKRGGSLARSNAERERLRDIHSRLDGRPSGTHSNHSHNTENNKSVTALAADAGKYFDCADVEETVKDHVIPRRSETEKQLLKYFPRELETEPMRLKQRTKDGKETVVTNERVIWRSDKTLLRQGKPFQEIGTFKREGSVSVGLDTRKDYVNQKEVKPVTTGKTLADAFPVVDNRAPVQSVEADDIDDL